jgi:L-ectoine synthase
VSDARWTSVRMLLADDGMGFSFHITFLEAGLGAHVRVQEPLRERLLHEGAGSITDLATGETHEIKPGVMYALDKHDRTRCAPPRKSW